MTDGPGLLSTAVRNGLDLRLEAYQKATGHQVLVWIGTTTGGDPLEDWTVKAFAAWRPGRAGKDDGLALFVFTADRKARLEVGYGLEGLVPDAIASRILHETILPGLAAGKADVALVGGVDQVLKGLGGETGAGAAQAEVPKAGRHLGVGTWILLALAGIGLLVLAITNPGIAIWLLFHLLTGGRGGGRGSGMSEGGGRSGGGGASGSW